MAKKSVLFICLGNICRSPIAEAVFNHVIKEQGVSDEWEVDSAALGPWHVGKQPDKRARECMKQHGVAMDHRARMVTVEDFKNFNYIFGMDEDNIRELKRMEPRSSIATVELLGKYDPQGELIIRDPYYDDGAEGFEKCYVQCLRDCDAFLKQA